MKIQHGDPAAALCFQWSVIDTASRVLTAPGHDPPGPVTTSKPVPPAQQPPRDRYYHAACLVGNHVYIHGGKGRYSPLKDLWRLDVDTGHWESLAPWGVDLPHLYGHTMTAFRSQILIFGGSFSESIAEETPFWILNTELQCMRQYRPDPPGCARPTDRREHSCVVYKNSLYMYGGFLDSSGSTDEFWAFKIEEEVWRLIWQHKPGKRHGHVAVVMGNHMWLHGGMKRLKHLSDMWTYNFSMCSWDAVKSVGASPALSNHTAHVVKNQLLLFGGNYQGKPSNSVWLFQFDTVSWRQITVQHGDMCSPITLHCSVALGRVVQEAGTFNTDRTRSVPQLSRQGDISQAGQLPARPWTSPGQDPIFSPSLWPSIGAKNTVDMLQLENVHGSHSVLIDKNNNASQENLTCEVETSFFVHTDSPNSKDNHTQQLWIQNQDLRQAMNSSVPEGSKREKIRPGSHELCYDGLPLLKRFQSVNSDFEVGNDNLTLTLSDEQVYKQDVSSSAQQDARCEHSVPTGPKLHGGQHQSLEARSASKIYTGTTQSRVCDSRRQCDFVNPIYSATSLPGSDNSSSVICGLTAREGLLRPSKGSKRSASLSDIYGAENISPNHNDLVLEDLEGCDITNLFYNVDIASPSKLSASLNQLSSHVENNKNSSRLTSSQHISYDDITSSSSNPFTKPLKVLKNCSSLHNVCSGYEALKNFKEVKHSSGGTLQGRYTKNTTLLNKSKLSAISRNRQKYFSSSQLDSLVTTSSIGTQTTESQFSHQGNQLCMENTGSGSVISHSIKPIRFDGDRGAEGHVPSGSTKSTGLSNAVNLAECQLCLLIIGGQTESHSFTAEPLKLWKCLLL